jgi:cob(I)alamin adenosyltransferase
MKKGYVQIYTGNGKGKTTAAMGLALRAAGHGFKVKIVQFLKGGVTGELNSIQYLETVELLRVSDAQKYVWSLSEEEKRAMQERSKEMLERISVWFKNDEIDVLILDEIMAAIRYDIVTLEDILSLLKKRPNTIEVIMTGRDAPCELCDMADLISEINDRKHYFEAGVPARMGIEF